MIGFNRRTTPFLLAAFLVIASGSATARELAAQEREPVRVTREGVELDFQNADLRLVIAAVAEAGGLNVVYGDLPNRRVTLRLAEPVPVSELEALLRNLAQANGLTVEQADGILRITVSSRNSFVPARARNPQPVVADGAAGAALYVYRLRHVPAGRLASTLQALFGGAGSNTAGRPRGPAETGNQHLDPADLAVLRPAAEQVNPPAALSIPGGVEGEVQIVADELTNSILVRASPGDWRVISQAIDALDLRPLQVLIEVLIAEVRRDRTFDLGVQASTPATADDEGEVTFVDRIGGALLGETAGDVLVRFRDVGSVDIDVALSALAANGEARSLSRPILLAQNNLEARILVGSERPFIQVFRTLPTDVAIRDQIVQYRDVGTELTILPTINPDGYVNLQVVQEVSNATNEAQFGAPVISTREAATNLFVRDGETAVIGGLIDHQTEETRSGIPILKDIPVLGWLFGTTHDRTINTELFLFLTPHIIRSDDDLRRIEDGVERRSGIVTDAIEANAPVLVPDTAAAGAH